MLIATGQPLVPALVVDEHGSVGSVGRPDQCAHETGVQEGQVRGEHQHPSGRDVLEADGQRRHRAAAGRVLPGPAHRPDGVPLGPDAHGALGVGASAEDPVEQSGAAYPQGGLVGAVEPARAAAGEHHGVERFGSGDDHGSDCLRRRPARAA